SAGGTGSSELPSQKRGFHLSLGLMWTELVMVTVAPRAMEAPAHQSGISAIRTTNLRRNGRGEPGFLFVFGMPGLAQFQFNTIKETACRGRVSRKRASPFAAVTFSGGLICARCPAFSSCAYCSGVSCCGEPRRFQASYELLWSASMR